MKTVDLNFIFGGVLFLLIIVSGFWLEETGVPYKKWIVNVHKFIALGSVVFIAIAIIKWNRQAALGSFEIMLSVLAITAVVGALVSGGIISAKNDPTYLMSMIHKVSTGGIIITVGYLAYLYFKKG